jgi:hypothetical protein
VCVVEPAVAVIVTVEVPAGVPVLPPPDEEPELPPHPVKLRTAIASTATEPIRPNRNVGVALRLASWNRHRTARASKHRTALTNVGSGGHRYSREGKNKAALAVVVIVSVVDAAEPLGVTVAGLNEQAADCGNPEHAKLVAAEKPPDGVTVTVVVAELPAATVALAGLAASVKSPEEPPTVTFTALDVDDANVPSPP